MIQGWHTQARSARDRRRRKARQQRLPKQPAKQAAQPATAATQAIADTPRSATSTGGWRSTTSRIASGQMIRPEDYSYVYSDLKRIAILGGSIFAILIVLSFVIR